MYLSKKCKIFYDNIFICLSFETFFLNNYNEATNCQVLHSSVIHYILCTVRGRVGLK